MSGDEYFCEICAKSFPTLKGYKIHQNAHNIDKQYTCELCPKKFSLPRRLKSHIDKVHSEKMYECTKCLNAFATIERLGIHRDKHLCERFTYPCTLCQKVFRSPLNLEKHLLKCENAMEVPLAAVDIRYNALNLSQSLYQRNDIANGF